MDWTTALAIWGAIEVASKAISAIKNGAALLSYLSRIFKKIESSISGSDQRKKPIYA
jgi:hypothetical protein